ncbi:MAG: hypothetical protein IPP01_00055 [Saprospiraceae bacterium]|nr:hypothetical protein [Saprospiraceae bacterium]
MGKSKVILVQVSPLSVDLNTFFVESNPGTEAYITLLFVEARQTELKFTVMPVEPYIV